MGIVGSWVSPSTSPRPETNSPNNSKSTTVSVPSTDFPPLDRNKLQFSWSNIDFSNFDAGNDIKSIVGQFFNSKHHQTNSRLIVKVIDVLLFTEGENVNINFEKDYNDSVERAWREAQLISDTSKRLKERDYNSCVLRLRGVCDGYISNKQLGKRTGKVKAVAIVMETYKCGTIENYIHNKDLDILLISKLQLLHKIAKSLMHLHSIGVIYGNVKASDVILTDSNPPEIRFKDFGNSLVRTDLDNVADSMQKTSTIRATNPYQAPELMINPFNSDVDQIVAKPSRKTDVYAFSILAWEILSREKPFNSFTPTMMIRDVRDGRRPPLDSLPDNTPPIVTSMLKSCWSSSRQERLSAIECTSVLQHCVNVFEGGRFDIFFSHAWVMKPMLSHVYQLLTELGYRVWYDQEEMGHNLDECMSKGIANSKVVVVCVNKIYQQRRNYAEPVSWADEPVKEVCNFETNSYCDLSELAGLDWDAEDGPTDDMLDSIKNKIEGLRRLLKLHNCIPTLNELSMERPNNVTPNVNIDPTVTENSGKSMKVTSLFVLAAMILPNRKSTPTRINQV